MKNSIFLLIIFFLAHSLLVGCSTPYRPPLISPNTDFDGVEDAFEYSDERAASIIMIHGMCHHDKLWMNKNVFNYNDAFDMSIVYPDHSKGDPSILISKSLEGVVAYKALLKRNDEMISLYGIVYSQPTLGIKQEFLCPDVSKPTDVCTSDTITYNRKRAILNAELKNELLNNCLADAVLYLGPLGNTIRSGVRKVLSDIFIDIESDNRLKDSPLIFVSESLGSKVLTDAFLCDLPQNFERSLTSLVRTTNVFLGANQVPLLNLGNNQHTCDTNLAIDTPNLTFTIATDTDNWGKLLDIVNQAKKTDTLRSKSLRPDKEINLVSFTDPNDLLSYEVNSQHFGKSLNVINVNVSNSPTWFNYVENPLSAHVGYRNNKEVLKIIRWGNKP